MGQDLNELLKQKAAAGVLDQHSQNEVLTGDGQRILVVIYYEPQYMSYWVDVVNRKVMTVPGNMKLSDVVMQSLELPANTPVKDVEFRGREQVDEEWIANPLHRDKQLYECSLEELRELDAFQSNLSL
jgi:hypothetical protein